MSQNVAVIVGISGVSSSGKTTLARILRDIFPKTFILHEDDFYKTDQEIPVKDGIADWDCLEAIDLQSLEDALKHIRRTGSSPPNLVSKEDQNSVGECDVDAEVIEDLRWRASKWMFQDIPSIAIIDGFLLYSQEMESVRKQFDVKMFLRTDHQTAKSRREARAGYVTLDGFWKDPPGYVDKVVWPNYVHDHAFLFEDGDVEGQLKQSELERHRIDAMPVEAQGNMTKCVEWAFCVLEKHLTEFVRK